MKKSIIVDFLSGTPSSTYSVSTGYSVGSEWINTNNGNRFYHKTDGNWVPLNVESFYIQGGTSSAFDTTSDIYRTGSLNIGTGTATDGRFVVSSITGSVSFVVDNNGSIYNYSTSSNTKFGYLSLQNNTTGSNNTAFGTGSLYSNTSGGYNTAYGASSLYNNSTGVSTFVLSNPGSGYTMSTTFSNVQLSYISGSTASTYPTVTVFVGVGGTVSTVTLVTTGTGFIDTTTVMGTNLGGSGTTFSINVLTISSGRYNTGVGAYSLGLNTTGPWNTAIGYGSLYNNISGNSNTAVGYQSLNQNTTGPASVAIGLQSLYNNTTGQQNTALGYRSLYLNSVGSFNIAIGTRALYSNIADKNTVVGGETMYSNLTGTFNTALGQESLRANIAGSYNTAVGTFALLNSESNYTVAVGRDAGRYSSVGNLIASTESLFLGYNSKSLTASSTNEIVIGASASGNGSNSVTLGSDSITKTILKGNIGVGTASPTNVLDVVKNQVGSTRINIENTDTYGISTLRFTKSGGAAAALYENVTNEFTFQNATNGGTLRLQTTTSGGATNTALTIDSNQNIGVGTASPSTKLHIFGTQSGAFRLQDGTQAKGYVLTSDANGVGTWEKTSRLFNFTSNTYQTVSGTVSATSSAISSSMFSDSDVLRIQPIITLLAPSVNVVNISYYISTSPTLVGATQIGNYNVIAGNRYIWSDRSFWTLGGIFIGRNFTASSQSSENNSGNNLDSVSIPSTFYILVTATTTGTDLACISSVVIQKL